MADTAVTIARTRTSPLDNIERLSSGNQKYKVLFSDIAYGTGSTDTVTMTLGATPDKWVATNALANVTTAFAGTTAMTMIVGTTTSTNAFITAQSILTAGVKSGATGLSANAVSGTASASMVATFTNATGGSPSALTAGELDIYLSILDTTKLG
ncbi:MAG TPA: hypothetical protein VEC57_00090 [Candidatus Limnocylindrales bacterium]|nr:hypothetical protein [Candidatus Limnocylindrales bacterium]